MVDVIPAHPMMIHAMDVQTAQASIGEDLSADTVARMLRIGSGFAAVSDGRILGLGGVYEMWRDRGVAWALLSARVGPAMPAIHRAVSGYFAEAPFRRIEAHIDPEHQAAVRWAGLLGFELEGTMRSFFNGKDFRLYARVRG